MPCLKVRSPRGERLIPQSPDGNCHGKLQDEEIIGVVWACGGGNTTMLDLEALVTPEGLMVGNIIKAVTNKLGIKQCLSCKGRQQRYNQKGLAIQKRLREFF